MAGHHRRRGTTHIYQPGLLFLPFGLYGHNDPKDLERPIGEPLPRGANFLAADILRIDTAKRVVETSVTTLHYDFLIGAMGCRMAPEEVEGLAEPLGRDSVHTFYTLEGATAMRPALERMRAGPARDRRVRHADQVPRGAHRVRLPGRLLLHPEGRAGCDRHHPPSPPTPGPSPSPTPTACSPKWRRTRGVNVVADFAAESVDAGARTLKSFDGRVLEYDLLCAIPPEPGPAGDRRSNLGDGTGYALTDPRTLRSRKAEGVYFLGDNTNVSTSKAGSWRTSRPRRWWRT